MNKFYRLGLAIFLFVLIGFYINKNVDSPKVSNPILANINDGGVDLIYDQPDLVKIFKGGEFVSQLETTPPLTKIEGLSAETDYEVVVGGEELKFRTEKEAEFYLGVAKMVFGKVEDESGKGVEGKIVFLEGDDLYLATVTNEKGVYWFEIPSGVNGVGRVKIESSPFKTKVELEGNEVGVPTMVVDNSSHVLGVITYSIPTISIPPISVPTITVPSVAVPSISIPTVNTPSISLPSISLPSVFPTMIPVEPVPTVVLPKIEIDKIEIGEVVDIRTVAENIPGLSGSDLLVAVNHINSSVSRVMGIGANGKIHNLFWATIGGETEIVGSNFGLNEIESVLVNISGGWKPVMVRDIGFEEIKGKIVNLEKGEIRVVSIERDSVLSAFGVGSVSEVLDKILTETGPSLIGLAIHYINPETGLVETVIRMASHISPLKEERLGQVASFIISKIEASPYASYFIKHFSWIDRGEDAEVVCSGGNCCSGNKTSRNPSGKYPEGTFSPGRDGGNYECQGGRWVRVDKEGQTPVATKEESCFCPKGCNTSSCYVGLRGDQGYIVDMKCCKVGSLSPTSRPELTQKPLSTQKPSPTAQPWVSQAPPTRSQPTTPPVSNRGSCNQHVTGRGCGKMGLFSGCQAINETVRDCVSQSECTVSRCLSNAWANARAEASAKGATLDEGKTVINCTVSFSPGGC